MVWPPCWLPRPHFRGFPRRRNCTALTSRSILVSDHRLFSMQSTPSSPPSPRFCNLADSTRRRSHYCFSAPSCPYFSFYPIRFHCEHQKHFTEQNGDVPLELSFYPLNPFSCQLLRQSPSSASGKNAGCLPGWLPSASCSVILVFTLNFLAPLLPHYTGPAGSRPCLNVTCHRLPKALQLHNAVDIVGSQFPLALAQQNTIQL